MFIVRDETGEIVVITTRREDADAFLVTKLDDTEYTIEEIKNVDL